MAAADVAVGTSSAGFLGFEVGASSAGLAGANTSVASGVTAQFWNPALLADMTRAQASMMHASWLGNLQYEWIGYARPIGPRTGTASVSLAYFHMPSLNGVDQFDNPIGEFKVYDMALTVGLARTITHGINVGANGKFIRQTLATVSGTGAAVDLGVSTRVRGFSFGASVQNLGSKVSLGGGYPLPRQVRFGVSREVLGERLLLAADYNIPSTYYRDLRLGAEIRAHSAVAVRVGYRHEFGVSDDPANGLSFGLGAHVGPVNVDYAMTPDNEFADVQRLSFGYTFGGGQEKPEPEPEQRPVPREPVPKGPPVIASLPAPKEAPPVATHVGESESPAPAKPAPAAPHAPAAPKPSAPKPSAPDLFAVVLGNYQSEQSAQSELKALQILGFSIKNAQISLVPGEGYRLSLARLNSKKAADELAGSLSKLSFQPRVEVVAGR